MAQKESYTIEVSPGERKGLYIAECPKCHTTREGSNQGKAASKIQAHMVGVHRTDVFAEYTVKLQK